MKFKSKIDKSEKSMVSSEEGYVMIAEVEDHLHYATIYSMIYKLRQGLSFRHKHGHSKKKYSVSIFIASGQSIDEKIDEVNRRISK